MYISNYNIGAGIPGQPYHILMHGYTGAIDKVPSALGHCLSSKRGEKLTEELLAELNLGENDLDRLSKRGYITHLSNEEEKKFLINIVSQIHQKDLAESPTGFMLIPTYLCNLRCPYCFQSHKMHAGKDGFNKVMSIKQVSQAFSILDDLTRPGSIAAKLGLIKDEDRPKGNIYPPQMTLFGGEPLSELTQGIIPHIIQLARERNIQVGAITNGVGLDLYKDYIGKNGLSSFQITLDGYGELHNKTRKGPGLKSTFQTIVKNVGMALEKGAEVSIRINVTPNNIEDLEPLNEMFLAKGWGDFVEFNAYAAAVHPEGKFQKVVTQAELVSKTSDMKEKSGAIIDSYENWARDILQKCLTGEGYPFERVAHCSAETGLLIFDPFDDIYACWEDVGMKHLKIGTYQAGELNLLPEITEQWLTRFPGSIDQCASCQYAMIHTAGCASHARKSSGSIFASACESFKEYFPETLGREYLKFEKSILEKEVQPI